MKSIFYIFYIICRFKILYGFKFKKYFNLFIRKSKLKILCEKQKRLNNW